MTFTLTFKAPLKHLDSRCCTVLQASTPPNNVFLSTVAVLPSLSATVWPTVSGNCYVKVTADPDA